MKTYDIIIVGGGISGTIAAISASRKGAKTLVVEKNGFLGGMLTAGGVGPMMTFHAGHKQVIKGITEELINRLVTKGKSPGHITDTTKYTYSVTPFDAESMKHEMEIMLLENGGNILYNTMLAGVEISSSRIRCITVCNKAGLTRLEAKVFIDATGDADLSAWSGVEFTKGRKHDGVCQPMTMNMKMRNVDIGAVKEYARGNLKDFLRITEDGSILDAAPRLSIAGFIKELNTAKNNGEITFNRECIQFFETNTSGEVIVNTTRICGLDSTDPWDLTMAEIEGRKQVRQLTALLKKRIPGFKNS